MENPEELKTPLKCVYTFQRVRLASLIKAMKRMNSIKNESKIWLYFLNCYDDNAVICLRKAAALVTCYQSAQKRLLDLKNT